MIAIVLYIIALLGYVGWNYFYNKREILKNIDSELYRSAVALKYILPEDLHDRAVDGQSISANEDKYIANKLTKLVKETSLKYAYTIIKQGQKLFFVASDISADPETERGTFYFYQYEGADDTFISAFEKKVPSYKTVSDQWGTVRTVIVPEKSPGGVKYLACADYDITHINKLLQKNLLRSIATIFFFLALYIPIIIVYTKLYGEYLSSLRKREEKYRTLTELLPIVVFELDNQGKIKFANKSGVQMTGYDQSDFEKGLNIVDVIAPESHETALKLYDQVLQGIYSDGAEYQIRRKDGSTYYGYINTRPTLDSDSPGLIGYIFDLTRLKEAEFALRKSEETLIRSKKMESLGLLAGGVAHDLNNILSGIVSYPELLLMDLPEDSKLRKPIETMQESGHRAAAIVQDLLTVARGVATTKEPINLNDLINDYLSSPEHDKIKQFYPLVSVEINLDADLLNIKASYVHIRKILMNLVSNASEAIEGSGIISVSTMNRYIDKPFKGYENFSAGEYVVLSVKDNGSGISPDDLERIFEPFFTKKIMGRSGTGLGLAVVWNTVQDHKGVIDVKSDKNGTVFEIYFPITREEISTKDLSMSIQDYMGNSEMILVVDDLKRQREISCKMLTVLGYKTKSVSSGEDAIEYLKEHSVDLILLDMIMVPGINGRETYERIVKINPRQKAIITSGYAETDDVKAIQNLGAGRYLKKPLTIEILGLAVKQELEKLQP
ncbi:MAG: ATP-binding protein [Pseudomonadota bacterium]